MAAQSDEAQRVQESVTVFNEIMTAPDKAFLTSVLNKAEGIAVFPGTIKGIGAQHGRCGPQILRPACRFGLGR
jgi:lipid-binding SYLF domain-containing protein